MKPHETEALANALHSAAEEAPRFRGSISAVFARVQYWIEPEYIVAPWLTDPQSFANQLRTAELEAAMLQHQVACWVGVDEKCRLILLERPKSAEEALIRINEQTPLGLVCRYCGIEDSRDELNPLQGAPYFIHDRCAGTWQGWRAAVK